ncbi:MAG: serine/threonine-protein kinase, partial [Polyangiaceae bacterium]
GMGVVEVALEQGENGFERVCALKRLLPEGARDKRQTDMFLREARLAALLSHPNVVHGFAFGEVGGEFFLAMEYVEGETLARLLTTLREKKEKLPAPLAAFIVAEICEGLHAVHELKDDSGTPLHVVHRDVSPHNVMIAYEAGLKLLDFGVAKIEAEPGLTRTGEVKGKTAYMSPEQAMGEAALDLRSDLYSVGAVLFECVSGRKMWEGTEMEVLRHLALDEPPKLEDVDPKAPSELCALYTKLIARNPADRPASAENVASELRAFAESQTGAGTDALRALMKHLFAAQAIERKNQLERALAVAAPSEADVLAGDLRASLNPEIAGDRRSHSELVASVQSRRGDDTDKRPVSRTILAALAIVAIAGASFLAIRANATDAQRDPTPAASLTIANSSSIPSSPSSIPATPVVASTTSAPTIASASAPTNHATPHDEAPKIPSNSSSSKHHEKPGVKPPSLDVDPNPI